jgi:hypothetical protein
LNSGAPVYLLQLPFNTDAQGRIVARLKKARLRYRSFDPSEQIRLPAPDAIDNVASSLGVVVPLASAAMVDARVHNLRAAFVAGLAQGMGKTTAFIQNGDDRSRSTTATSLRDIGTPIRSMTLSNASPWM